MWGKLLGGAFGFMIGGPLGAVLGAALGHTFDAGMKARLEHDVQEDELPPGDAERIKMAFFTATFSVMGHIAKADGHVPPSEIALAEAVMKQMKLDSSLRAAAIKLFNEGKKPDFEPEALVLQFRQECQRRTSLYRMFVEIQIQAALADGVMTIEEEQALLRVSSVLGFTEPTFRQLEMLVRFSMGMMGGKTGQSSAGSRNSGSRQAPPPASQQMTVRAAYQALGADPSDDKAAIKRAYRRLMSQHHPDKLVAKGLPEEMIKLATDKTQHIQKAYEKIKENRGW
jgi:DnaJ like chaperone protein